MWCTLPSVQSQSIPTDWQSTTNLSSIGFEFSPVNQQALLLFGITTNSLMTCSRTCHSTVQCRIFDYDGQSHWCRIFEGDITTMGSIIPSLSSQSRVGSIKISPQQFINLGQSCLYCQGSRYLTCVNNICQCPSHTYFDGTMCQSQKLIGAYCNNSTECRSDLNYTCLARMQCGFSSLQNGILVGGYGNGTPGNDLNAFNAPLGMFMGNDSSLYVSDFNNGRVIKLIEGSLNGSIVAGTGIPGGSATQLNLPAGSFMDSLSNLYVTDSFNARVMLWYKNSNTGVLAAGTGMYGNTSSTFSTPSGLAVDSVGNMYISDYVNHRVQRFKLI